MVIFIPPTKNKHFKKKKGKRNQLWYSTTVLLMKNQLTYSFKSSTYCKFKDSMKLDDFRIKIKYGARNGYPESSRRLHPRFCAAVECLGFLFAGW